VSAPLDPYVLRPPTGADHGRVLAVLDPWWEGHSDPAGTERRASLLPRLFFDHFQDTSVIVETPEGALAAFMVGWLSSRPDEAYVHFLGVDPARRGEGLGRALYERFFALARAAGRTRVRAITSPPNAGSAAFHTRIGFRIEPGPVEFEGRAVQPDYDGPGLDRVCFVIDL
jgi:ribosomal protein S18 acetylase RimI-like enzyme